MNFSLIRLLVAVLTLLKHEVANGTEEAAVAKPHLTPMGFFCIDTLKNMGENVAYLAGGLARLWGAHADEGQGPIEVFDAFSPETLHEIEEACINYVNNKDMQGLALYIGGNLIDAEEMLDVLMAASNQKPFDPNNN